MSEGTDPTCQAERPVLAGGLFPAVARLQQSITEIQGQVEVELSLWFFKSND